MADTIADDVAAVARLDAVPRILDVICRTTGMGFAAVARVTEQRWVACAVRDDIAFGLKPGGELELGTTICNEIRQSGEGVIIDCVADDPHFAEHHTPKLYGFQSYISVPIRRQGAFFGTLCAIDPRPAKLSAPETRATFELFAELIGAHLDAERRVAASEAALLSEKETAELREQFIAVLGHDLRDPLAAIDAGAQLMLRLPLNAQAAELVAMQRDSIKRMGTLIDNLLDLARGRLGGGLGIERRPNPNLAQALEHVVGELRLSHPGRAVESNIVLTQPVSCDAPRVARLLANLAANALTHGAQDAPVRVRAHIEGGMFELAVSNSGAPIPPELLPRLFQPFSHASARMDGQGLGLGLYIAAEIAKAHDGALIVTSDAAETRFTFRMPLA